MRDIDVVLEWYEVYIGACTGTMRQVEAIRLGLRNRHGNTGENAWSEHVEAACAELAFAKYRDKYWGAGVNTFRDAGDVGNVEVRHRSKTHYDLIVRPDDCGDRPYVLVVGTCPAYRIVGWIWGRDAKQEQWRQVYGGREPAYFVPQDQLREFPE